jgi:MioC protein
MARQIPILFATETGMTELVSDEIVEAYQGNAHVNFEAIRMDRAQLSIFQPRGVYLLITSSTGKGELPRNASTFCAALRTRATPLEQVSYGILGFGDRFYTASFGGGPRMLDELMQQAGASRVGELGQHDRQSGIHAEAFALSWVGAWLTRLE